MHYTSPFRIHYDDGDVGGGGDHNANLLPCILESVSLGSKQPGHEADLPI
jgi:hypothetical protein